MIRTILTCFKPTFAPTPLNFLSSSHTTIKAGQLTRSFFTSKSSPPDPISFKQIPYRHNCAKGEKDRPIPDSILRCNELACTLIQSIMLGNSGLVSHALNEGANANQAMTDGSSVLHYAAEYGNFNVLEELLKKGAKINLQTREEGDTPLHKACMMGNHFVVEKLLQYQAKFTTKNNEGYTPLELTILFQKPQCATSLIHKGAPLNQLNPIIGYTPLMLACEKGSYEMANLLVYFGADTNMICQTTPLHLATNHPRLLQLLLDHGGRKDVIISSDSTCKEQIGDSPLHTAARWGNLESVKILLKYKSNIRQTNKLHQTALDVAQLQLIAHRINPSNSHETTNRVCEELERVIALLDVATHTDLNK